MKYIYGYNIIFCLMPEIKISGVALSVCLYSPVIYLFEEVELGQVFCAPSRPSAERRQVPRGTEPDPAQGDPDQHRLLQT